VVNGSNDDAVDGDDRFKRPDSSHGRTVAHRSSHPPSAASAAPMLAPLPLLGSEALKRALVADLVRADVTGRGKSLRGTEAKDLADALLSSLHIRSGSPKGSDDPNALAADDVLRLTCAAWLGVSPPQQPFGTTGVKKIHVRRFRVSGDGYESPMDEDGDDDADDAGSGGVLAANVKQTFDIEWELGLGCMAGKFAVKGLVLGGEHGGSPITVSEGREVEMEGVESSSDWRRKWLETKAELEKTREELKTIRDDVLKVALGQNR
jgi:hypothetical protein